MTTRTIPIEQVKIGERFRKDLGDIQSLADSIKELGLLQPIVVNEATNELIAGHRRLEACKLLGWTEITANMVNLEYLVKGEYAENAFRKEFTKTEAVAIKQAIEPIEREMARQRQIAGKPVADSAKGEVREIVASNLGMSHDTLSKAEVVVQAAKREPEKYGDLPAKMDSGEISTHRAYNIVNQSEGKEPKKRESKKVVVLPSSLFAHMMSVVHEAMTSGKSEVKIMHNGQNVLSVGEVIANAASS
jgi:ParB-like chromosome segregation protein Spo0J